MQDKIARENRKELFLRACRSEPVERVPVWIMRQAGRYLPEYRAVREKHAFLEVCKTPELAAEVSLQPYRAIAVDAVIVFSDILIPAEAMGMALELTAAAPWTLACYMVEGRSREGFPTVKKMMYQEPRLFRMLLETIARNTAAYLQAQTAAGAAAVQLFDTWAGELSQRDYDEFALPTTQLLLAELNAGPVPVILYTKGSAHLLGSVAQAGANVLSVDWRVDLGELRHQLGNGVALQGNVDPGVLLGPEAGIRAAAREAIEKTAGLGHILNLGHGILPA